MDDDSHLRIHINPAIGNMSLEEVRPRHLKALLDKMAASGAAPRTRRNVYSTLRSMFHAAQIRELIPLNGSPCILKWHTPTRYGRPDATMRTLPHRQPPVKRSGPSTLIPLCDGNGAPARRT